MMQNIFFQITVILATAVTIAFFIRLLRQPLIIAYIIAGVAVGPMFLNLLRGNKNIYQAFAEFGMVLLLFVIGLNLNFNRLKSIGKPSFITGFGQVFFTAIFGFIILVLLNFNVLAAAYLAVAITFSSTIVIIKLLNDKKDTETVYGKHTIGLMLVQDIIAVLILIVIGIFSNSGNNLAGQFFWLATKGVGVLIFIFLVAKYFLPWFLHRISHSSELLFIFTISWCFSLASLLYWLGFSLEIGAIFAGIALSSSPYQPEIASRIKPLRDFFLILFFIVLGSEIGIGAMSSIWFPSLILSGFILIGNPLILYLLFRWLKFTRRNSFLAGITAAQVSEFGFVMLFTGKQFGYFGPEVIQVFTMVAIVTIFTSSYLIIYSEKIYNFFLPFFNLFGKDEYLQINHRSKIYDAWVVGYHRIGIKVCEALKEIKTDFSVIDYDPKAIEKLKQKKIHAIFGDIADVEFLEGINIASANLVIMTIPSVDDQINLINHVKKFNPKILIIANAYHTPDIENLYKAGVDYVMMPHFIGGDWIANILKKGKMTKKTLTDLKTSQMVKA